MKKNISILMAVVSATVLLSACGSNANTDSPADAASASEASADAQGAESSEGELIDTASLKTMDLSEVNPEELVTLGEYKGVTVEVAAPSVTDADVDNYIEGLKTSNPPLVEITDRAVQEGDTVDIDYVGKYADTKEAFDGGTAQGAPLVIGSHSYIDGFEDGLIGVNIGETVDLNLTFPENYGAANLAGKDVIFTVTLNGIKAAGEINDEWIASLGYEGVSNMEQLRAYAEKTLTEEAEKTHQTNVEDAVIEAVQNNCTFGDVPEELVNRYLTQVYQQFKYYALQYSYYTGSQLSVADYLTMAMQSGGESGDPETFIRTRADNTTQQYLMFAAIAAKEGIKVTDEDVEEFLKNTYESASSTAYSTFEDYKAAQDLDVYKEGILADKVVEFLADNANVVEPAN
ncbi:MAG: trigger factor [Butyrivibrio sp.]|nr:trigger factor [Butyrivibrio sp.]